MKDLIALHKIGHCCLGYRSVDFADFCTQVRSGVNTSILQGSYETSESMSFFLIHWTIGVPFTFPRNRNWLNPLKIFPLIILNAPIIPLFEVYPSVLKFPSFKRPKLETLFNS